MTFDLNLFAPLLAGLACIAVMVLVYLYLGHKYGQEDKRSRSPMLTDSARPEIIEELNKLSSASPTSELIDQLYNYTLDGKTISEELRNIAKLPDTVYGLNYEEHMRLMDIVMYMQHEANVNEFHDLMKKYNETGFPGYLVLANLLKSDDNLIKEYFE